MPLEIKFGQHSSRGRKAINQDFHGMMLPERDQANSKGTAFVLCDGISSSNVSQIASETTVAGFLQDYYATPEQWTVRSAAKKVLNATNSWLYAQTRKGAHRYDIEKGYVCTFSALILKSASAHIFHVGDTRVYRQHNDTLEQLTEDHRVRESADSYYLSRAIGMREQLEIDYLKLPLQKDDVFVLASDGVYEHLKPKSIVETIAKHPEDLDKAAQEIVAAALENGSQDNLSIQIVQVCELGSQDITDLQLEARTLPPPPTLNPNDLIDGYRVIRTLYMGPRSHVHLVKDEASGTLAALKTLSADKHQDTAFIESFLMEQWVASRVDNPHILRPLAQQNRRNYLYSIAEYVEGISLRQWMNDNPEPELEVVRKIIEQIAKGLLAMHRQEMLHQDLRPENILIDNTGTVKIIDFGATRVAGVEELSSPYERQHIRGTLQYTAPEYLLGEMPRDNADLYSLAVICYEMLSAKLPYGARVGRANTRTAQRRLIYQTVLDDDKNIPAYVDEALRRAVDTSPTRRYQELSEFLYHLRHPSSSTLRKVPLIERDPVLFWKSLSAVLFVGLLASLFQSNF